MSFLIKQYSKYIYFPISIFKKTINRIILKEPDYLDNYIATLKVFKLIVTKFDSRLIACVFDIVFKYCYNNFIDPFITYLERNDRTIIKFDQKYFKIGNVKKNKKSLLQIAMNDTYNQKLERFTNENVKKYTFTLDGSKILLT